MTTDVPPRPPQPEDASVAALADILAAVRRHTGADLSPYRDSTLRRQIERRVAEHGDAGWPAYARRVADDPAEAQRLQHALCISVTRFFRDPEVFERLEAVLRGLAATRGDGEPLRLWVAGCATGEEAYALGALLLEAVDTVGSRPALRLFATDADPDAIETARRGRYPAAAAQDIPAALRERHFELDEAGLRPTRRLRDLCVFSRHDLLSQPHFIGMDLVSCRNVLIYFEPARQARLIEAFRRALVPEGWLLLGRSEAVHGEAGGFTAVDKAARLYRRTPSPALRESGVAGLPAPAVVGPATYGTPVATAAASPSAQAVAPLTERLRRRLLEQDARASVVVDAQGQLLQLWGDATRFLRLPDGEDLVLGNLLLPALREPVQSLRVLAAQSGTRVRGARVELPGPQGPCPVRPWAEPLDGPGLPAGLLRVGFEVLPRVTRTAPPPAGEAATAGHGDPPSPDAAGDELAALREELAAAQEQLRTLAATVERDAARRQALQEDLQAAGEELQASNEELQASNEELVTLNEQLGAKSVELSSLNGLLLDIERSTDAAMVVVDEQLRVRRHNPLAVRVFGLLDGDVGRPLAAIPASLPLPGLERSLTAVLREGRARVERIDHGERHVLMQLSPLREDGQAPSGVIASFTDVSALRRAELEAARLAAIVEHSEDAIVGKTLEGIVTSWNPGAQRLFGWSAQEAVGQPMVRVFPPDLAEEEARLLERVRAGRTVPPFDTRRRHRDGRDLHVSVTLSPIRDEAGGIVGVSTIARDITGRVADDALREATVQRLEELVGERTRALRDHERRLQAVLDGLPGLVACHDLEGRVRHENLAHHHLAAQAGDPLARALDPHGPGPLAQAVPRVLQGEPAVFELATPAGPGRAAEHWRVSCVPHRPHGEVEGFIVLGFEVTELRLAQAQADAANRAKSDFLAGMSHEIRTPLHAVLGLAQLGQRDTPHDADRDRYARILGAGRHLLGVIEDVLDFSRIEAGHLDLHRAPFTIDALLGRVTDLVQATASAKSLVLRVERDPGLAPVWDGDLQRLAQVLVNLAGNAVKFTQRGEVVLRVAGAPDGLHLAVGDTGPGMPEAVMHHLFDPFVQGQEARHQGGGTGLGLSICKRLVDRMGGRIAVRSVPGEGTTVDVRVPLRPVVAAPWPEPAVLAEAAARQAAPADAPAALPAGPRLSGRRLLVAEDNPVNALVLRSLLEFEGAQVEVVENGLLALERVRALSPDPATRPQLLLCDIEMPELDGLETARRLRASAPWLPVVGLSAHAFAQARREAGEAGMVGYLTKPYLVDDVVALVQDLLGRG